MITTFIAASDRIPWDSLRQSLSFVSMVIYTNMILNASSAMTYYHYPLRRF